MHPYYDNSSYNDGSYYTYSSNAAWSYAPDDSNSSNSNDGFDHDNNNAYYDNDNAYYDTWSSWEQSSNGSNSLDTASVEDPGKSQFSQQELEAMRPWVIAMRNRLAALKCSKANSVETTAPADVEEYKPKTATRIKTSTTSSFREIPFLQKLRLDFFEAGGTFCLGREEWTVSFALSEKFQRHAYSGNLRLFLEEVLCMCLKENMGRYTLSGAKLVTAERSTDAIGGTVAHVKKIFSSHSLAIPVELTTGVERLLRLVCDPHNLPEVDADLTAAVRRIISKVCSRFNEKLHKGTKRRKLKYSQEY